MGLDGQIWEPNRASTAEVSRTKYIGLTGRAQDGKAQGWVSGVDRQDRKTKARMARMKKKVLKKRERESVCVHVCVTALLENSSSWHRQLRFAFSTHGTTMAAGQLITTRHQAETLVDIEQAHLQKINK